MTGSNDRRLDLGCGKSKREGFEGADRLQVAGVDHVFDFDVFPYPFLPDTFCEIWADQVLEHLAEPVRVMEELHRIACDKGIIHIGVPYFRGPYAWIDPTHRRGFSVNFARYFSEGDELCERYGYTTARFKVVAIEFDREWRRSKGVLHGLLIHCAERWPVFYELYLSHILPLNSLTFTLQVQKPARNGSGGSAADSEAAKGSGSHRLSQS